MKVAGDTMSKSSVVIVGAGPGGLAAALQLAQAGVKVTIIESRNRVGGRCSNFEANGFRFDVGPTFFLYPRILDEIFRSIGRDMFTEIPMTRLDPQYRISFGAGGELNCTPDLKAMDKQISNLSPRDAGSLDRFMNDNRRKLEKFRPVLESPFDSPRDLLRPSMFSALPHLRPWRSLAQELQTYFHDPRLMIAFSFQSKYLGMSPFRCPSLFSILSFLEYEHGVFHPTGGCGQVSVRMAEIAREMGVEIRLNESVTGLEFQGRKISKVQTDKSTIATDRLIINADFAEAMRRLVPDALRKRWSDAKIAKKQFSCSTYMMYLGVRGNYDHLAHHNIHIAADYEKNLAEIEKEGVLPRDPSFYVANPIVTDPTMAPAGKSSLYVLVPVPNLGGKVQWTDTVKAQFRDQVLDRMGAIGIEGIRDRIEFEQVITPDKWRDDYAVYRGATFNLAHSLRQMLHLRPHNRFEELDGVYLVGGGTHPGSGLPVIYESTRITCKHLLADMGVSYDFITRHNTTGKRTLVSEPTVEMPLAETTA
jgi:phytoene desaturase